MAGAHDVNHEYHLVNPSPWPLFGATAAFVLAVGFIFAIKEDYSDTWNLVAYVGLAGVIYTMFGWWRDVVKEAHGGDHTRVVQLHLRYGMIMFIASEVMFFVAWFWAYFDVSLFYNEAIQTARVAHTGGQWPPKDVHVFNPFDLPFINTVILLTSGTTVTWAHHALIHDDRKGLVYGLALTVVLGIAFTILQAVEYSHAGFGFGGNIYGATFFMATGFHGFHVIVGTVFLTVCLIRAMKGHFTPQQHFGFEAAAWYWHFVDVVWLFLFVAIYCAGSDWGAAVIGHAAH